MVIFDVRTVRLTMTVAARDRKPKSKILKMKTIEHRNSTLLGPISIRNCREGAELETGNKGYEVRKKNNTEKKRNVKDCKGRKKTLACGR